MICITNETVIGLLITDPASSSLGSPSSCLLQEDDLLWQMGSKVDLQLSWGESLFASLLKCGSVPKHVAFIMDGNRRFARKRNLDTSEGHRQGYRKFIKTVGWCKEIGIQEITVFAFSLDNLGRTQEELDALLVLMRMFNQDIVDNRYGQQGWRFRFIGSFKQATSEIKRIVSQIELLTKDNSGITVNVAYFYKSQEEITTTINQLAAGVRDGRLSKADIKMTLFNKCLYTRDSPPPEVIVRTSGETRLSDFLLCQGAWSYLHFTGVLWPELTVWHVLWAIFKYQVYAYTMNDIWKRHLVDEPLTPSALKFIENLDKERDNDLQIYANLVIN